ncbi:cytochrome c3 family protein [Thiovibrio sp. JS02]
MKKVLLTVTALALMLASAQADDRDKRTYKSRRTSTTATTTVSSEPAAGGALTAHQSIQAYDGPSTCIACHQAEAQEMLDSLHMQWAGPTPKLSNTSGEDLGKAIGGINTFCTYAMSSKGACFTCHVRADGNAPHPPSLTDVDCLMCHQDTYQRKFTADPTNSETVTNVLGETKTYIFGLVDAAGNYFTEPDFSAMPAGTTMVDLARTVHMPTKQSCLRCHAKAGGGDWTKRGDMGLNSANPTVDQDVHMASAGANLSCTSCHGGTGHKIGGRGIDLRQSEAVDPKCTNCHSAAPHDSSTLNRHAAGQVSCQVCHIRTFAKGGATEMSRDWREPHWNPAFCSGQGGFVGHEVKVANVKPEYRWFDGTSYVYNTGETIQANADGTYTMAKANGNAFDGKSKIVPIKNHWTVMPLLDNGQIVPPAIMWMFMTGDFDLAVQKGMEDQGLVGNYTLVEANAEMLITHGVDPKSKAPQCSECHTSSGITPDGTKMLPFAQLGYHVWPAKVKSCTLCHSSESASFESMHKEHAGGEQAMKCTSCHTSEPIGLVKPQGDLCNDCHGSKSWRGASSHKKHIEKGYECSKCHRF